MQLLLAAHAHGYATNPMAGFDKAKIAEVFGLDSERYVPVLIISIGKAAIEGNPSVRLPLSATVFNGNKSVSLVLVSILPLPEIRWWFFYVKIDTTLNGVI